MAVQDLDKSLCSVAAVNVSTVMTCGTDFTPYIFNDDSKSRFRILAGVLMVICFLATFQNGAILLVMLKEKCIRKIRLNKFLMVLTSIDLLNATIGIPIYVSFNVLLSEGRFCCHVGRLLFMTAFAFVTMSITTIAFITFQLYLAILRPFAYTGNLNTRVTLPLLMSMNVMWAIMTSLMVIVFPDWWKIYRMAVSSFVLIIYLVMCCLHFCIYRETHEMKTRSSAIISPECGNVSRKTLKLATSVLISFGLSYLPYVGLTVYGMVNELTPYTNTYVEPWGEILGMTTCVWNPLLYCLRLSLIRKRIFALFDHRDQKIHDSGSIETTKPLDTIC